MQNEPHARKICGAKTRAGTPCKNSPMINGRCRMHGGKSTGPKDKEKLKENKNAEKHGLFSKYLPEETMNLINNMESLNAIDMLWDNIKIQYAAIIRSQRIMYVKDKDEMIKELKKKKEYDSGSVSSDEVEYEFQFAWDRQATFLQAQSRAMAELRNMITKYEDLLRTGLATEEQELRIEKLKVDIDKVKAADTEKPINIMITRKGEGN